MVAQVPGAAAVEPAPADIDEGAETDAVFVMPSSEPRPDDGDANDERIELVRTGLVRVWIVGDRYRLRRPFFGEFRKLRMQLEDGNDEIQAASDDAMRLARDLTQAAQGKADLPPDEWREWRRTAQDQSRQSGRKLTDLAEELRLEWWTTMWDLLTLDGRPPDWPPWIVEPALQGRLVAHWRSSPQGRG